MEFPTNRSAIKKESCNYQCNRFSEVNQANTYNQNDEGKLNNGGDNRGSCGAHKHNGLEAPKRPEDDGWAYHDLADDSAHKHRGCMVSLEPEHRYKGLKEYDRALLRFSLISAPPEAGNLYIGGGGEQHTSGNIFYGLDGLKKFGQGSEKLAKWVGRVDLCESQGNFWFRAVCMTSETMFGLSNLGIIKQALSGFRHEKCHLSGPRTSRKDPQTKGYFRSKKGGWQLAKAAVLLNFLVYPSQAAPADPKSLTEDPLPDVSFWASLKLLVERFLLDFSAPIFFVFSSLLICFACFRRQARWQLSSFMAVAGAIYIYNYESVDPIAHPGLMASLWLCWFMFTAVACAQIVVQLEFGKIFSLMGIVGGVAATTSIATSPVLTNAWNQAVGSAPTIKVTLLPSLFFGFFFLEVLEHIQRKLNQHDEPSLPLWVHHGKIKPNASEGPGSAREDSQVSQQREAPVPNHPEA